VRHPSRQLIGLAVVVAALALAAPGLAAPSRAQATDAVPHEVVVEFERASSARPPTVLRVRNVRRAIAALRARPDVVYAVPNVTARAAEPFLPSDLATIVEPGGAIPLQWNFAGPYGVGAPDAWGNLIAAGFPGGAGVTVAVLDTGVAYADRPPFRRSPDLSQASFVPGYDFVDGDRYPFDLSGHGTHVASTIAEETNNGYGLTGLAYGVRIMPVRVLDRFGVGDAAAIARGVRFAADHGARVINLSLSFDTHVTERQIPELVQAIDYAGAAGSLVVAAAGNQGRSEIAYPARAAQVLSVGATTEHGCLASYSNVGSDLDLVAPGGGEDAALLDDPGCVPGRPGRPIYQITSRRPRLDRFGIVPYVGTSMATPHVSATAALVLASGVLGPDPSPAAIAARLTQTARDLGAPGYDPRYGWGLVSAAAATAPQPPAPEQPAAAGVTGL
jgi:serine protease